MLCFILQLPLRLNLVPSLIVYSTGWRAAEPDLEPLRVACRAPGQERVSGGGGDVSEPLGLDLLSATLAGPAAKGREEHRMI